ncbi:MAG: hypothetical protein MJZ51_04760 [Bacteroidales bacterium]|nr:hypothetical protein [Bacteroidales bacterium]
MKIGIECDGNSIASYHHIPWHSHIVSSCTSHGSAPKDCTCRINLGQIDAKNITHHVARNRIHRTDIGAILTEACIFAKFTENIGVAHAVHIGVNDFVRHTTSAANILSLRPLAPSKLLPLRMDAAE